MEKEDLDREYERVQREGRLTELLKLFEGRKLRAVGLFGNYAHGLADEVKRARPDLKIFKGLHPSLQAMNRKEGNRERLRRPSGRSRNSWVSWYWSAN